MINPLDMMMTAPKTQEVSPIRHAEIQKPINDQIDYNQNFNSEVKHNSKVTIKSEKSAKEDFRYNDKKEGNSSKFSKQSNKRKKEDVKEEKHEIKMSKFDIKI